MQHKRKMSDIYEGTESSAVEYGYDSLNEPEDEPISIQTGLSMPAWKTPSLIQEYSPPANAERSVRPTGTDAASLDTEIFTTEFPEFEQPEEPQFSYSAADARAAIRKERPIRISVWKRFKAWVERLLPSFADESFLSRLNMYLGGLAFVFVLIIFVVVLIFRPF